MIATPKTITTTVPAIHQRRPKRRIPTISSAPPAPHSTAPIACDLATSPTQPSQSWVTSPTSFARSRATALTGSVARPSATEIAAAAAAPGQHRMPARPGAQPRGRLADEQHSTPGLDQQRRAEEPELPCAEVLRPFQAARG